MIITFNLLLCLLREMAKSSNQRNDSSQMKDLLQPDHQPGKSHKEKHGHEREHGSKESSHQASSSTCAPDTSNTGALSGRQAEDTSSSSCCTCAHSKFEALSRRQAEDDHCSSSASAPSDTGARRRKHAEVDKPPWTQKEDRISSCCPLSDLKKLPQCHKKLGQLKISGMHTILVDVNFFNCEGKLMAQDGRDVWHRNFVKMPNSQSSFMIVKTGFTKQPTKTKRWDVIFKQLNSLAKKTTVSVKDLEEAIIKCNPKYKDQWTFDALSEFVKSVPKTENYFSALFPKIAELALKLPDCVKKTIPLLQSGHPAILTLSQLQIACLLANAFFCTFPHRNATAPNAEYHNYPSINFTSLFGKCSPRKKEKLRAIMHYFKVVTDTEPGGMVTFERRCLGAAEIPDWRSSKEAMPKLHVTSRGTIEREGTGMLQVDFASSWIGGGVLGSGLVQEEILFLLNPELIVSRLFTEKLGDNECLIITGSQQFSSYSGFGDSFEWTGPHVDNLKRDDWARLERQILAIDALHFRHSREQYDMIKVTRELNKAYCGFKAHGSDEPDIATGKWGCGAFNGDPQLKAVIQLMAAAKAKRGLAFFTFDDEKLTRDLEQVYSLLVKEGTTVKKLYGLLEDFCAVQQMSGSHVELFDFIRNNIGQPRSLL
ncbi:poly(ADP-ribose) glycohydrolase isoform X1 [Larimichthys crocea]|uniref:poly(ADP-ribose) glycohydrolase isoform X1 n=2 Tax=Larimichthys crocea TaxID=215358 RepID=UPI0009017CCC|nr:poly(ADP-ribose) glycohydrolase isoform X1 [Larimichthys crocea]